METVGISVGGSILIPGENDVEYTKKVAGVLARCAKGRTLYVVVGGGRLARQYISMARDLGANESALDEMGIRCTRLNARLLSCALGPALANPYPPETYEEALVMGRTYPIVVMGGAAPGYTTDAVTALMAERAGANRLVIATSVDAVYSEDPKKNPRAQRYDRLTHARLTEITQTFEARAGSAGVVDPTACRTAQRANMPVMVVHGRDLKAFEAAIAGRKFKGTLIED